MVLLDSQTLNAAIEMSPSICTTVCVEMSTLSSRPTFVLASIDQFDDSVSRVLIVFEACDICNKTSGLPLQMNLVRKTDNFYEELKKNGWFISYFDSDQKIKMTTLYARKSCYWISLWALCMIIKLRILKWKSPIPGQLLLISHYGSSQNLIKWHLDCELGHMILFRGVAQKPR